ncbi:hypothetical protein MACJ_003699 [Theileria orientalis]|uniref:Uncharacterized protein n=1 Tax=Theileria orientalis TaxID=68886 RepID=A0A976SLI5_THEOR|nr:hypothetical protein MACJ_003699 [Theileria orientalis]
MNLPDKLILVLLYLFTYNGRYIARLAGAAPGLAGYASSSTPELGQARKIRNNNSYDRNLNNSNNSESNYIPANPLEPPPAAPPASAPSSIYYQSFGMAPRIPGPPQPQLQQPRQISAVPVSQTPGASPQAAHAAPSGSLSHYAQFVAPVKVPVAVQPPTAAPQQVSTQAQVEAKLVIFDINDKKSTKYVTYSVDNQSNEDVFIPISPHSIFKITNGDTVVWTSSNNVYPDEVRVMTDDRGEPKVRIFFPPPDQPQAKPDPSGSTDPVSQGTGQVATQPGKETYSAYFTTVEVDRKKTTNKIKYERDDVKKLERFTARAPFKIERVTKSGKTIWPHGKLINPALKLVIRKTKDGKDRLKVFFFEDEDEDDEEEEDPEFSFQPRVVPAGTHYGFTAPQPAVPAPKAPQPQQAQPQLPNLPQLKPIQPPQLQQLQPAQIQPQVQPAQIQPQVQIPQVQPVIPPSVQPPVTQSFGDEPFESESSYDVDFDQIIGALPQTPYPYGLGPLNSFSRFNHSNYIRFNHSNYSRFNLYRLSSYKLTNYSRFNHSNYNRFNLYRFSSYKLSSSSNNSYSSNSSNNNSFNNSFHNNSYLSSCRRFSSKLSKRFLSFHRYSHPSRHHTLTAILDNSFNRVSSQPIPVILANLVSSQAILVIPANRFNTLTAIPDNHRNRINWLATLPGQLYPGAPVAQRASPDSEEQPYADILLLTKDPNNKSVLLHQDVYNRQEQANVVQYLLSQHARCTSIRSGKKTIWKHYPQEYGDSYPQTITHNKNTQKLSIQFKEFIILYQRASDGKWNDTEYDLRLFTPNPRDKRTIIEIDSTQYTLAKVGDEKYEFRFNEGVYCSQVHIDDQIVWQSGEFQLRSPLTVSYHEQLDEIAVGDNQRLLVYYKLDDGWPFYRTKYINGHRRPITGNTNRDRGLPYTSSPGSDD